VRGLLRFSPRVLLLLEAGSCDTGIVGEPRVRGTAAAGNRYRATASDIVTVDTSLCELVILKCSQELYKRLINPIINPNPFIVTNTRDNMKSEVFTAAKI
jgi:hypothetical protein